MGRPLRCAEGGLIYHVLNRASGRAVMFEADADYQAFERVLAESVRRTGMRVLAFCVMPTHWHLVVWPRETGELSRFTGWLTLTHAQRWHAWRRTAGRGHLYQGRFKSFPVQDDEHFYRVCRYVERNALRANLVGRAEDWRWGSLYRRLRGSSADASLLADWPLSRGPNWIELVNTPQSEAELEAVRRSVRRGRPFGTRHWSERMARQFGLEPTMRSRGRPRKRVGR